MTLGSILAVDLKVRSLIYLY